jgi:hypothetical protein
MAAFGSAVVSSVTRMGLYEPWYLQVARNQITMHQSIFQFGQAPTVTTAQSIWPGSGVYAFPAAATVMKISSGSASDTSAGTGARTVRITGLNSSYNVISEIVSLSGQTAVDTVNSYLRINNFEVFTCGSNNTQVGVIYAGTGTVTSGVPATVYSLMPVGYNKQTQAIFTVPSGYTAYVSSYTFTSNCATANVIASGFFYTYANANAFPSIEATARFNVGGSFDRHFDYPLPLLEKTDLDMRVLAATSSQMTGEIHILLVKNDSQTA